MDMVSTLVTKVTGWIDTIFSFFGLYTTKYSKYILILIGLWLATKIFKIKLGIGGSHK